MGIGRILECSKSGDVDALGLGVEVGVGSGLTVEHGRLHAVVIPGAHGVEVGSSLQSLELVDGFV